jgi:hypothetical protein
MIFGSESCGPCKGGDSASTAVMCRLLLQQAVSSYSAVPRRFGAPATSAAGNKVIPSPAELFSGNISSYGLLPLATISGALRSVLSELRR